LNMMNDSCGDESIVADATYMNVRETKLRALKYTATFNMPLRGKYSKCMAKLAGPRKGKYSDL
jgi:hypothetical protein